MFDRVDIHSMAESPRSLRELTDVIACRVLPVEVMQIGYVHLRAATAF